MSKKVVFITGAAIGIGEASAREFVRKGWRVALCDIQEEKVKAVAKELGEDAMAWKADVRSLDELDSAMKAANDHFGQIDAVVANAGIVIFSSSALMPEEEWLKVIDVNINGVWRTFKAAFPYLKESKGFALALSSAAATVCIPFASSYSTTKAAVLNFCTSFRDEVKDLGIGVGTIHPMIIRTALVTGAEATPLGREVISKPWWLWMGFPLKSVVKGVVKAVIKRKKTTMVPFTHASILWFPRFYSSLLSVVAWRRRRMGALMTKATELNKAP